MQMQIDRIGRREFMTLLGGATLWPLTARAQQAAMPKIGFLRPGSPQEDTNPVVAFRQGLKKIGFIEGQSLTIEYRWAGGQYDRLRPLAAELVGDRVALIFAGSPPAAVAAKAATATIPIVFTSGADPVALGLVASLNRPGGNVTGVSFFVNSLGPKRLELLAELVPNARRVAALINPTLPDAENQLGEAQDAAKRLGRELIVLRPKNQIEIETAFTTLSSEQVGAVDITPDPLFLSRKDDLIALAARHRIPAMYFDREFAAAGGLISYGPSLLAAYRQAGVYTGTILKGAKPVDLPVIQPTKFELVINLKTAKSLGITVPQTLYVAADDMIE
jgi:putative tryptophan/tyrosine transport system substrate-binding protein